MNRDKAEQLKEKHGHEGAKRAVILMIERAQKEEIKEYWEDVLKELENL